MTQTNAVLVSQTTATANGLREEAVHLQGLVGRFQLGDAASQDDRVDRFTAI